MKKQNLSPNQSNETRPARVYATVSLNGERVEVIGRDSSDNSRVLVLSSRGLTSYVHENDLI